MWRGSAALVQRWSRVCGTPTGCKTRPRRPVGSNGCCCALLRAANRLLPCGHDAPAHRERGPVLPNLCKRACARDGAPAAPARVPGARGALWCLPLRACLTVGAWRTYMYLCMFLHVYVCMCLYVCMYVCPQAGPPVVDPVLLMRIPTMLSGCILFITILFQV